MKRLQIIVIGLLLLLPTLATANNTERVIVFAASSLHNVLAEIATTFNQTYDGSVTISYAGSGTLAKQIYNGAPASIYISANSVWVDYLKENELLVNSSIKDFLGNSLVLITQTGSPHLTLDDIADEDKIVIGIVDSVPAGTYAKQALVAINKWENVQKHIAEVDSVRTALSFVSRGEAKFGVVYKTDAIIDDRVDIADEFESNTHDNITYPIAIIKENNSDSAAFFYEYLMSDEAKTIYKKHGFIVE